MWGVGVVNFLGLLVIAITILAAMCNATLFSHYSLTSMNVKSYQSQVLDQFESTFHMDCSWRRNEIALMLPQLHILKYMINLIFFEIIF